MSDLHIDDFYRDVARALVQLYGTFPRKQAVYLEDLLGPIEVDEFGLPTTRFMACFSTLLWLADEGWLRAEATIRQEALEQAVLTQRAFVLLSALPPAPCNSADGDLPPSVAAAGQSRIAGLRRALASGSSIELCAAVQGLLQTADRRAS